MHAKFIEIDSFAFDVAQHEMKTLESDNESLRFLLSPKHIAKLSHKSWGIGTYFEQKSKEYVQMLILTRILNILAWRAEYTFHLSFFHNDLTNWVDAWLWWKSWDRIGVDLTTQREWIATKRIKQVFVELSSETAHHHGRGIDGQISDHIGRIAAQINPEWARISCGIAKASDNIYDAYQRVMSLPIPHDGFFELQWINRKWEHWLKKFREKVMNPSRL